MDLDELEPTKKPSRKRDLEPMSIEALREYIMHLEAEISRARAAIAQKEGAKGDAEAIFNR